MAADDQKVKRQDAAVASSSLLRTSSARMYGKNSLKVFWAIGLFFLLSFMERTTPTEAVVYPEEMKKAMEEREKADFRELPTVNVYGSLGNLSIPALPYLDDLEAVVKDLLAGREPRHSIGFSVYPRSNQFWLKGIKGQLRSLIKAAGGPVLANDNIESISFKVADSGQDIWTPSVLFDVHITDYNKRTHIVGGISLTAKWFMPAPSVYAGSFVWKMGNFNQVFEMHPGTSACLKRFMTFTLEPHNWTEMNFVPFTNAGTLAYGVHIEQGKKKVSGVFLYLGWNADVKAAVYGCHHIDGELEVKQRAMEKMWKTLWEMCGPTFHFNDSERKQHMDSLHKALSAGSVAFEVQP
eukprot:GHVS01073006.1.p1 GENE.GHVS01073006.1~~GHVS01073006.1.p1  ORF type:complete len:373 (+),score=35.76 GHVS01073006.1:65-1120(+)